MNVDKFDDFGTELTLEKLLQLKKDLDARFPKPNLPNPADVGPHTFHELVKDCVSVSPPPFPDFSAITLHVRYDAKEGELHPCTCRPKIKFSKTDLKLKDPL